MAYEQCLLEVTKIAGRELTTEEKQQVSTVVENLVKKFDKEAQADGLQAKVMEAINEWTVDVKAAAAIEKRNAALNAMAKIKTIDYFNTVWKDEPEEGIKAILGNSILDRQGSKNGLAGMQDALQNNYVTGMLSKLASGDLTKIATSGQLDDQIWRAMSELNMETPDKNVLAKLSPEAIDIAKIYNEYTELARTHANGAGAWIKKMQGYVVKRNHDVTKIAKAAGDKIPINDIAHQKAWVEYVSQRLDWEKSMPDVPLAKRGKILESMFQQFSNGYHVKFGEGGVSGLKGAFNIGKKMSQERQLHFKSPELEYEYHKKFASGDTLAENMVSGLMKMGRDTATMRKFGPNARGNLDSFKDELMKKYTEDGRGDLAKRVSVAYEKQMKELWPLLDGSASIPGNADFAQWSGSIRNLQVMRDLGGAILSAPSDLTFYASTMRYIGDRSGSDFFSGMREAAGHVLGGIGKKVTPEQMEMASEFGIALDAITNAVSTISPDTNMPGRTSDWVNKFFKLNGLSWWQDKIRLGSVMSTAHRHANQMGKAFTELPTGMQALFRQFDIKETDWNAIRKGVAKIDSEGKNFLTPETIADLPDEAIAPLVSGQATPTKIAKYREGLVDKYRTMYKEVASLATSEPGKMERAFMLRGSKPGTMEGELLRHFWMYKSFTVSVMRKHLGREVHGYSSKNMSTAQALKKMMSDPSGAAFGGMANLIGWGTMMGYTSMALKDLAKGREPRVPTDAASFGKIFAASAAQSGSFGIYGDFLFGEMKSRMGQGPLETFLGPTWKSASSVTDLYSKAKAGDDVSAEAFRFALNNTPGYNLFYTRLALDYMIVYRMQEMMNPGYLRRMENKLKREKQQEYLLPPSRYAK